MPWSTWTTRSPGVRPAASVRKFSARLRRRGARISRSPSTSCSEITVRPGASKPCSSGQTARPRPPSPREVGGPGDLARVGDAAVGEQAREALAGAGGVAGDDDVARAAAGGDVGGQRAEEADLLLLALGGEVAADPPAGVDHAGAERLRQGGELVQRARGGGGVPGGVVEVELARRHRLVDGAELRFRRERLRRGRRTARRVPPSARRGRRRSGRRGAPARRAGSRRGSPAARGRTAASARSPGACGRR